MYWFGKLAGICPEPALWRTGQEQIAAAQLKVKKWKP
jgi:hypothetical protein